MVRPLASLLLLGSVLTTADAHPPAASYIFPPGGQRGKAVAVKVGGLFLHERCGFEILGPGIRCDDKLQRTKTLWFEGPLLPLPDSQRAEDYPQDMAGNIHIAADAPTGFRFARVWTSQGATPSLKFLVGDLPEIVETEIPGDPIPVEVTVPLTINGRVFPRGDIDDYAFTAVRGRTVRCEVHALRLGSPLDARLQILDRKGRLLAESDGANPDPILAFSPPRDGTYLARIHDVRMLGGQAYVYRLTLADGPHVESTYPLGGRKGSKVRLSLNGCNLPQAFAEATLPENADGEHALRFELAGKPSNPVLLDVDDLPEFLETEPNDEPHSARPFEVPAMLNGRIERPGDVDWWAFSAEKNQEFEFDLRAGRLDSPLVGILWVQDEKGKEVGRAEPQGSALDPSLRFRAPDKGTFRIAVADRFRSRGGSNHAYRLRIASPAGPDFRLRTATDACSVPRKGQGKLKLLVETMGGFNGPISLKVEGLPPGVKVASTTIPRGKKSFDLVFQAEESAAIGKFHCRIQGEATIGTTTRSHPAEPPAPRGTLPPGTILGAVALPTPFTIKGDYEMGFAERGTVHRRKYRIERNGYEGPIEVKLADRQARHLQGVTGETIVVPAGANEFTYEVKLPPWMDLGRTCRVCVMGTATIQDRGREHRVSFSSVNQNEQFVAVVGPGRLALRLDRNSIALETGKSVALIAHIQRAADLKGPVRIELVVPSHISGIRSDSTAIPAGANAGTIRIHARDMQLPNSLPLTVRATLTHQGQPFIAEAPLELVSPR